MQGQLFTQDFLLRGILDTPPWQAFDDAAFGRFRAALQGIFSTLHDGSATATPSRLLIRLRS